MENVYKLVKLASKIEADLTPLQRLKLARARLAKEFEGKDMTKETSGQVADSDFKKRQESINKTEKNSLT